jgi:hypothetical protein
LVPCVESDLKGGTHAPLPDYRSFAGLKRSTCLDPGFDIVEATVATQAVKFPKRFRIVGDTRSGLGYRDIRTGPWVTECVHLHQVAQPRNSAKSVHDLQLKRRRDCRKDGATV